jgi:hypothetical protein
MICNQKRLHSGRFELSGGFQPSELQYDSVRNIVGKTKANQIGQFKVAIERTLRYWRTTGQHRSRFCPCIHRRHAVHMPAIGMKGGALARMQLDLHWRFIGLENR